ncbi:MULTISPECIES: polymer-forming cytoskeletal protein [unclassified Arenibacter]|jgi:cytoskeletal protein CcmA (bactofilin family)|uniref:bactofilin family protein n=1 Tax=unclassified Arenibacter TaxID=2615047 RepID=UPI000E347C30|nr:MULTISPECIES: polymer-forming cytoskeletal protein [unclassified Arenibacter]MCM4161990.1 cell shape determination protein CcmA [Arenibacter sp. A80]RFT57619.1 polymer-forming cytoskeletal protein [Arenibacter sp. P308M17]
MFSDNKKPRVMTELGGQPNRIEKNTKIKGDIVSEADFRIDGKLDGNVKTSGKVVIGIDGYIHGKVECVNADIEGNFNGELIVSDLLTLKSSAVIEGTVIVSKLAVDPGATFNASCTMKGREGKGAVNSPMKQSATTNEPAKAS